MHSKTIERKHENDWSPFAESSSYYKNSLYIFGGGNSIGDNVVAETATVDRFYKINFPDLPCSTGTYLFENQCVPCQKGSYKDTFGPEECIQCPAGTFNE